LRLCGPARVGGLRSHHHMAALHGTVQRDVPAMLLSIRLAQKLP
jgi:hypothetical protein